MTERHREFDAEHIDEQVEELLRAASEPTTSEDVDQRFVYDLRDILASYDEDQRSVDWAWSRIASRMAQPVSQSRIQRTKRMRRSWLADLRKVPVLRFGILVAACLLLLLVSSVAFALYQAKQNQHLSRTAEIPPSQKGATPTLVQTYATSEAPVYSLEWSPDGKHIVAVIGDTVKSWNALTGSDEKVYPLPRLRGAITDVRWSPDGRLIAAGTGSQLVIWNAENRQVVRVLGAQLPGSDQLIGSILNLSWLPDGKSIEALVSVEGQMLTQMFVIWHVDDGAQQRVVSLNGFATSVAWSPDRSRIATEQNGKMMIWNASTLEKVASYDAVASLFAWSPDNRSLALVVPGRDQHRQVIIYDAQTGAQKLVYSGYGNVNDIADLAWSPDGSRLLSSAWLSLHITTPDGQNTRSTGLRSEFCIWNVVDGTTLYTSAEQNQFLGALAWSPDGSFFAVGESFWGGGKSKEPLAIRIWKVS
uniref:Uncharacterized protein n=1 Tax=Thermosporothrix sp. COM3 TaxID=2490863 RepID=A0A455SVX2_9CHLR|nr:hypothetical protein KTC_40350 [Thermosporothrix sp. COM3]